jgi:hypothetical protein
MRYRLAALAALSIVAGCSDSGGGGGGGNGSSATFTGIISSSDGSASGALSLVVATANPAPPAPTGPAFVAVTASGTLKFDGQAAVDLSGTYDGSNKSLAVTGGGYSLGGVFDGSDRLEGAWTGPNNASGSFVTAKSSTATAYCGTYQANDQSDEGTFSFVVSGSTVRGEAVSIDGDVIPLDGTIDGSAITIYAPGTTQVLASGTKNGNAVSGTYGGGTPGTWTGGLCQ